MTGPAQGPAQGPRRSAALARAALAAAVLLQLVVLYAPRAPSTGGVPGVDKVVHLLVFAAVAWTGRAAGVRLHLLLVLLLAHALVSEGLQHWLLPGRSGDWLDVAADSAGVLAGSLLPAPRRSARGRMGPWRAGGQGIPGAGR